jgi:hypothetical protein
VIAFVKDNKVCFMPSKNKWFQQEAIVIRKIIQFRFQRGLDLLVELVIERKNTFHFYFQVSLN